MSLIKYPFLGLMSILIFTKGVKSALDSCGARGSKVQGFPFRGD